MSDIMTMRNQVRGLLIMQGKSLRSWAKENGYPYGNVGKIVERFAGNGRRPRIGSRSLEVIEALERDTGIRICG